MLMLAISPKLNGLACCNGDKYLKVFNFLHKNKNNIHNEATQLVTGLATLTSSNTSVASVLRHIPQAS